MQNFAYVKCKGRGDYIPKSSFGLLNRRPLKWIGEKIELGQGGLYPELLHQSI